LASVVKCSETYSCVFGYFDVYTSSYIMCSCRAYTPSLSIWLTIGVYSYSDLHMLTLRHYTVHHHSTTQTHTPYTHTPYTHAHTTPHLPHTHHTHITHTHTHTQELCAKPKFFSGGASRFDVSQGMLGDCWLVAAIASLTQDPMLLNQVQPSDR